MPQHELQLPGSGLAQNDDEILSVVGLEEPSPDKINAASAEERREEITPDSLHDIFYKTVEQWFQLLPCSPEEAGQTLRNMRRQCRAIESMDELRLADQFLNADG